MASSTRLFVGNIPESSEENELRTAFSKFGDISSLDLKYKNNDATQKKFAFITISASNIAIESCIKHFSSTHFNGGQIYVTRARESFLERLQREREQAQKKSEAQLSLSPVITQKHPKINLSESLNPRKRKSDHRVETNPLIRKHNEIDTEVDSNYAQKPGPLKEEDIKKQNSDKKRLESMKKKRQEFKAKQMIIKTGLGAIDKVKNKKIVFYDNEEEKISYEKDNFQVNSSKINKALFEDDDDDNSDSGVNFEIKEQFEGARGQKVLELQSKYKSDKRFTLDERFVEDDEQNKKLRDNDDQIKVRFEDEKAKQLNILQDVLGVAIKSYNKNPIDVKENRKNKIPMGMLRFDPMQPNHAKFLAPVSIDNSNTDNSKTKKKKQKEKEVAEAQSSQPDIPKVEVSQEQFYKVSETLKDSMTQQNKFSLRSLFGQDPEKEENEFENDSKGMAIKKPNETKVKNPLDPSDKNPFKYDSSESEDEEETNDNVVEENNEAKAVWSENLFFSKYDKRFKEGLAFFNRPIENEVKKDRRELKFIMKKRLHNKDRKDQMFQKKIGGRRKTMKKRYNNKNNR